MGVIKARLCRKSVNDIDIIQIETNSNLVIRENGNTIEESISTIEAELDGVDAALELLLSGEPDG